MFPNLFVLIQTVCIQSTLPVTVVWCRLFLADANPLAPPPEMKGSVKLVDEAFQFCDGSLEFLLDQNDFMVVGCLGLQGVGKSTLLSFLAGNHPDGANKWVAAQKKECFTYFVPDLKYQYDIVHLHYSYEHFYDFCSVHMSCNWAVCVLSYIFFLQRIKWNNMTNQLDFIYQKYHLPVYLISGV